jgi:DNA-directed RNA polymerase I subunit RPA1
MVIRSSELLVGVLDKNALGPSPYGLIHAVYEAYGPHAAGALLSAIGRLLTVYLQVG